MTNLRHIIISVLLIGTILVGLIIFSVQFQMENNTNTSLISREQVNRSFNLINQTLYIQQGNATALQQSLATESSTPVLTALGFFFKSILTAGNTIMSFTIVFFSSFFTLIQESLGVPPIVTGVLMSIVLLILILAAWRAYRAGE